MTLPLSCDPLKRAAVESGYSTQPKETREEQKYNQQVSQSGPRPSCVSLVFECNGFWGPLAEGCLDNILKKLKDMNSQTSEAEFLVRCMRLISVTVQKCNANIIRADWINCVSGNLNDFVLHPDQKFLDVHMHRTTDKNWAVHLSLFRQCRVSAVTVTPHSNYVQQNFWLYIISHVTSTLALNSLEYIFTKYIKNISNVGQDLTDQVWFFE